MQDWPMFMFHTYDNFLTVFSAPNLHNFGLQENKLAKKT